MFNILDSSALFFTDSDRVIINSFVSVDSLAPFRLMRAENKFSEAKQKKIWPFLSDLTLNLCISDDDCGAFGRLVSSGGGAFANFFAARGPCIYQLRGRPRAFDTHAVSYPNITIQRILLEKQADWLICQGWEKIEEVCKGMFSILCMHFFIAYQARIT